ncbi:MAG: DUF3105 domain-containing protein, partial [Actinomycetota bacterium]
EERRRERLEARRQAKAEAEAARRRKQRRERLIRRAGLVAVAAVVFWFLFLRGGLPSEINGHPIRTFNVSLTAAESHSDQPQTYESVPPVAGIHNPAPAPCGIYGTPLPNETVTNEMMVHTLEHGAVGILYDPGLDPQQIEQIEAIVGGFDDHVFSAPYTGMDTPIALTAWEHLLKLDTFERATITEFIDVFAEGGSAPEANQACSNEVNEPFQPQPSAPPAPTPASTPSPEQTPDAEDGAKDKGARDNKGESKND